MSNLPETAPVVIVGGAIRPPVLMAELDAHINDRAFADAAPAILDAWIADGTVGTTV